MRGESGFAGIVVTWGLFEVWVVANLFLGNPIHVTILVLAGWSLGVAIAITFILSWS